MPQTTDRGRTDGWKDWASDHYRVPSGAGALILGLGPETEIIQDNIHLSWLFSTEKATPQNPVHLGHLMLTDNAWLFHGLSF